jgi:hypothetical protein
MSLGEFKAIYQNGYPISLLPASNQEFPKWQIEYDEANHPLAVNVLSSENEELRFYEYQYDFGNLNVFIKYNSNNEMLTRQTFTYSSDGRVNEIFSWVSSMKCCEGILSGQVAHDSDGKTVQVKNVQTNQVSTYVYNANGDLERSYNVFGFDLENTYKYDQYGNWTERVTVPFRNKDGKPIPIYGHALNTVLTRDITYYK